MHAGLTVINAENGDKIKGCDIRSNVDKFIRIIEKCSNRNDVLFIDIPRSFETIFAILACLQLKLPFTFCRENANYEHFRTTLVFDGQKVRRIGENSEENGHICYVITTSGTTGIRKQVGVPFDCIQRNIDHFCRLFQVTSSDSILFSTSLLFDPSIVELFMAFQSGCTLILTPDAFRSEPHRMQEAIEKFRPSIAQFTPTVFEMLPTPSEFRILLLGGSHFPLDLIRSSHLSTPSRIFNVYGVTEVSCWATVFEVEHDCEMVLLGEPIGGSELEVSEEGELVIGGPRQCYVDGQIHGKHRTGDRVERVEGGGLRLVGRLDRVVKHRGIRVCLDELTASALRNNASVHSVHFLHHNHRNLIQFVVSSSHCSPTSESIRIDPNTTVTATVIHIPQMPINSSGKVDEKELLKILDSSRWNFRCIMEKKLNVVITEEILEKSFVELGVKSLLAAELSSFTGEPTEALRMMLNPKTSIREFLEIFEMEGIDVKNEEITVETIKVERRRQPRMKWAVDLKKCIDGDVLVVSPSLIICASHSGIVVAVDPNTGDLLWRTDCKVRFEATPTLVDEKVVIGNKTDGLFFISVSNGEILSRIETIPVRAKVAFDGSFIYCTSENGVFHAIDSKTHFSLFHHRLTNGGTSVGPVVAPDGSVYATTTSGHVARVTVNGEFNVQWNRQFGPVFAEPTFLGDCPLILNVHGVLRVLDKNTGHTTDKLALSNEQCFSAPMKSDEHLLVATQSGKLIIVKSAKLEVLKVYRFENVPVSFVRTPKLLRREGVVLLVSIQGWILFARLQNRQLDDATAMPISSGRQVFTSPQIFNDTLVIAGRDDYLRAFQCSYQS